MSKKPKLKVGDYVVVTYNRAPRVGKIVSLHLHKRAYGGGCYETATVEGTVTSGFNKGSNYNRSYSLAFLEKFDEKWITNHLRKESDNWNKALALVNKDQATAAEKATGRDLSAD